MISIQVDDEDYQDLTSLASRRGRSVDDLIREAVAEYLGRRLDRRGSLFDIPPHDSGPQLKPWTREEIFDEMIDPD